MLWGIFSRIKTAPIPMTRALVMPTTMPKTSSKMGIRLVISAAVAATNPMKDMLMKIACRSIQSPFGRRVKTGIMPAISVNRLLAANQWKGPK